MYYLFYSVVWILTEEDIYEYLYGEYSYQYKPAKKEIMFVSETPMYIQ